MAAAATAPQAAHMAQPNVDPSTTHDPHDTIQSSSDIALLKHVLKQHPQRHPLPGPNANSASGSSKPCTGDPCAFLLRKFALSARPFTNLDHLAASRIFL